jgi:hypothetical protein
LEAGLLLALLGDEGGNGDGRRYVERRERSVGSGRWGFDGCFGWCGICWRGFEGWGDGRWWLNHQRFGRCWFGGCFWFGSLGRFFSRSGIGRYFWFRGFGRLWSGRCWFFGKRRCRYRFGFWGRLWDGWRRDGRCFRGRDSR